MSVLLRSVSLWALVAAAGTFAGTGMSPARAADLGGDCCADLEERVATLEATTVRKGNKVVSLTLSGQVNRALMWYNDGSGQRLTSVDNNNSSTRFRLQGDAKFAPGWSMGYYLEAEFITSNSFGTDQIESRRAISGVTATTTGALSNGEGNSPLTLGLRQSHWYVKSDQLGTVSIGRLSTASKDLIITDLSGSAVVANPDTRLVGSELFMRRTGAQDRAGLCAAGLGCTNSLRWSALVPGLDSYRFDGARYDSPTLLGFTLSLAAGDNTRYDGALRFANEFNGFRIAAGVSYTVDQDEGLINGDNTSAPVFTLNTTGSKDQRTTRGVVSVLHVPTGLFANGFVLNTQFQGTADITKGQVGGLGIQQRPDFKYYYVQGGLSKNWFGLGNTVLYGEYANGVDAIVGTALNTTTNQVALAPGGSNFLELTKSDVSIWGLGAVQNINSAATELYLSYRHMSADIAGVTVKNGVASSQSFEAVDIVMSGARIKF